MVIFLGKPTNYFWKVKSNPGCTFFLKKKKIWRYHYLTPVYQKSWWYDLQLLRYRVWQTEIGSYGSFFPFYHPKNQKKSESKKKRKKKLPDISSFYTSVPKTSILSGTVPQIQSETDNFLSFWLIFCLFSANNLENQNFKHVYLKSRSYDVCFLRYRVQQTYFFAILSHFFPFPYWPRKLKFGKNVINPEDIIILHMSTIKIIWCMVPEL